MTFFFHIISDMSNIVIFHDLSVAKIFSFAVSLWLLDIATWLSPHFLFQNSTNERPSPPCGNSFPWHPHFVQWVTGLLTFTLGVYKENLNNHGSSSLTSNLSLSNTVLLDEMTLPQSSSHWYIQLCQVYISSASFSLISRRNHHLSIQCPC